MMLRIHALSQINRRNVEWFLYGGIDPFVRKSGWKEQIVMKSCRLVQITFTGEKYLWCRTAESRKYNSRHLAGLCKVCRLWDNSDPPVCCSWCRWLRWGSQGWLWQQALHGTHWQEGRGNPGEQRGCWCFVSKSCSFRGTCRRRGLIALAGWRAHGRRRRRRWWWASLGVIGASSLSPWGGWCPDG